LFIIYTTSLIKGFKAPSVDHHQEEQEQEEEEEEDQSLKVAKDSHEYEVLATSIP